MLIVTIISTLIVTNNAMIHEINKVLNNELGPILKFDMVKGGYINDINLEKIFNYKLTTGPNGNKKIIASGNSSSIISASKENHGKGIFNLYLANTTIEDKQVDFPIVIKGTVDIEHKYGKLSPPQYRSYQYYSITLFLLLIMSILWAVFVYKYRTTLVKHHYAIGAIIWILTIETLISYFKLMYVNNNGYDVPFMDHFGTQIEVIRQTVARLFLILISLGWGIIISDQEINKQMQSNLMKLGLIYYFLQSILEHFMIKHIATKNLDGFGIIMLIASMQCFLETFIFWTIMVNLSTILMELKQSKQYSKYKHYKSFARALIILIAFATLNIIFEGYIRNNIDYYFEFTILSRKCFWHFNFMLMTIIVMILWRPTKSSKYYAFVEQLPTQETIDCDMANTEEIDIDLNDFDLNDKMHIGYNYDYNQEIVGDRNSMSTAIFEIGDLDESDPEIQTENEHNYTFGDIDGGSLEYELDLDTDQVHDSDHYDLSEF